MWISTRSIRTSMRCAIDIRGNRLRRAGTRGSRPPRFERSSDGARLPERARSSWARPKRLVGDDEIDRMRRHSLMDESTFSPRSALPQSCTLRPGSQ